MTLLIHILKRAEGQWCPGVYICAWILQFFLINGKNFNKSARTIFLSKYVFPKKCENHSREEEKIHSRNWVLQWKVLFICGSISKKLLLSAVSQWFAEKTQQMLYFQKRKGLKVIKYDILVCKSCHMMTIVLSYYDHHVIIWWSSYKLNRENAIFWQGGDSIISNMMFQFVILVVRWSSQVYCVILLLKR